MRHRNRLRAQVARGPDDIQLAADAGPSAVDAPLGLLAFFLGWILIGLALAFLLVRRGHDPRLMTALGIGLGPILLALVADSDDKRPVRCRVISDGRDGAGDLDILIVVGGDPAAVRELDTTLRSLGDVVRRTTLTTTVPHECIDPDPLNRSLPAATDRLLAAAALVAPVDPELVVLAGDPRRAPARFARAHHYDLTLHAPQLPSPPDQSGG
jgi:hypothetical protein